MAILTWAISILGVIVWMTLLLMGADVLHLARTDRLPGHPSLSEWIIYIWVPTFFLAAIVLNLCIAMVRRSFGLSLMFAAAFLLACILGFGPVFGGGV